MTDCIFCEIAAGRIPTDKVYEDDRVLAFRDINPKAAVHLLVIPRQHVASLDELDGSHDELIAHLVRVLPRLARDQGLETGYRTIINTGAGGGQEVFHLHAHLMGGSDLPGF
ncbi:MAG: histidine triad nucleotide-binding protein [Pseudomonadota bacterium]|nr:MAG: histidine triad nucleotide-binding protein [Pseudomonadota bacterium]